MNNKPNWLQRVVHFVWVRIYTVLYIAILWKLSEYIFNNWEKCISMKLFSQFDGNNILFLVWIAAIMLFFYDIEIKEGKFHRRNIEEAKSQVQKKSVELEIAQRVEKVDRAISEISTEMNGGGKDQ